MVESPLSLYSQVCSILSHLLFVECSCFFHKLSCLCFLGQFPVLGDNCIFPWPCLAKDHTMLPSHLWMCWTDTHFDHFGSQSPYYCLPIIGDIPRNLRYPPTSYDSTISRHGDMSNHGVRIPVSMARNWAMTPSFGPTHFRPLVWSQWWWCWNPTNVL